MVYVGQAYILASVLASILSSLMDWNVSGSETKEQISSAPGLSTELWLALTAGSYSAIAGNDLQEPLGFNTF